MRPRAGRALVAALLLGMALLAACAAPAPEVPAPGSGDAGMMGGGSGADMASGVIAAASNASITLGAYSVSRGGLAVERVLAPADGWIVVRSVTSPGAVLGRVPVEAGESRDITVPLTIIDGSAVRVALHVDRGVRGAFDYDAILPERSMDKPVFADSRPIERTVAVPGYGVEAPPNSALILVSDQTVTLGVLRVRYLLVPGPSWVCVNLVEDGLPGRRIGLVSRQAGESQEITVPLARDSQGLVEVTVFADRGTVGQFDYDRNDPLGSQDRPYLSAGVVVSQRVLLK